MRIIFKNSKKSINFTNKKSKSIKSQFFICMEIWKLFAIIQSVTCQQLLN